MSLLRFAHTTYLLILPILIIHFSPIKTVRLELKLLSCSLLLLKQTRMSGTYTSLLLERPSYFVLNVLPRDTEPCVIVLNVDVLDGKINSTDDKRRHSLKINICHMYILKFIFLAKFCWQRHLEGAKTFFMLTFFLPGLFNPNSTSIGNYHPIVL
uniref:Uncharacterized protein n=1 Tax=Pipistrellus kuhlii TaxID=59472 RepID=A0A7J7YX12_PIPKU|nr:hypothetical protein mPipKuh1_009894 [Pipistrellus kuhlii]